MKKLADIFAPKTVLNMEDEVIDDIASETEESKLERTSSTKKLEILEAALQALRRLDKHKPKGTEELAYPFPDPKLTEPTQTPPSAKSAPPPVTEEPKLYYPLGATSRADFERQMESTLEATRPHLKPADNEMLDELAVLSEKLRETGGLGSQTWEGLVAQLEMSRFCFHQLRSFCRTQGVNAEDEIEHCIRQCEIVLGLASTRAAHQSRLRCASQKLMTRQREIYLKSGPSEAGLRAMAFLDRHPPGS